MPNCTRCDGSRYLRSDEMECAEQDYSTCDACHGSGQREDQLRHYIVGNYDRHRRDAEAETKVWRDELCQIELCKPPAPVVLPDGRIMTYIGPLPVMENGKATYKD